MSSNQKKIRDIQRQMKRFGSDNPELIKRLEELKAVKEEVQIKEKLRKNSVKYHMVKFIERKKVTRAIRSLESKIAKNEGNVDELKAKKAQLEEDLAYVMYYPMEQKYVALFPGSEKASESSSNKVNSKAYEEQAAQMLEKSIALGKAARVLAIEAWKRDIATGRVDKVAHAMEVEYNGGNGNKGKKNKASKGGDGNDDGDDEEEVEYHKYTNNMQPSSALDQYEARIGRTAGGGGAGAGGARSISNNSNSNSNGGKREVGGGGEKSGKRKHSDDTAAAAEVGVSKKSDQQQQQHKKSKTNSEGDNEDEDGDVDNEQPAYPVKNSNKDRDAKADKNKKEDKSAKKDKKNKRSSETEEPTAAADARDDAADPFFLEEVDPEEEARQEVIEQKIKKNLSDLQDIRKVVNKNKYDTHKRLYGSKSHDNAYRQNKNHKKF